MNNNVHVLGPNESSLLITWEEQPNSGDLMGKIGAGEIYIFVLRKVRLSDGARIEIYTTLPGLNTKQGHAMSFSVGKARCHDLLLDWMDLVSLQPAVTGPEILQSVIAERLVQLTLYSANQDDLKEDSEWVFLIRDYVNAVGAAFQHASDPNARNRARQKLIEVAALAVAAIESIDRKLEKKDTSNGSDS